MLLENVFVHEDFLSTVKKTSLENKQVFGGTHAKDLSSQDFRDIVNLKLSMHLVYLYVCPITGLKKKKKKQGIF